MKLLSSNPKIFMLSSESCGEVARYAKKMLSVLGNTVILIENEYDLLSAMKTIKDDDMVFVISNNSYQQLFVKLEKLIGEKKKIR